MRRNTLAAVQAFAPATGDLRFAGRMTEQSGFQAAHPSAEPEVTLPLREENRETAIELLQANSQVKAYLLVTQPADWRPPLLVAREKGSDFVSQPAKQPPVKLLVAQTKPGDLFLHSQEQKLREAPLQAEQGSPVLQARERQYSRGPGPFAFSRETQAARKCNRAGRCGDYPNHVRCRPRRNRRALAGCDNKCSRSQHRPARRVRTFLIAAADKCRCLPRRIADSDIRSANSE